MHGLHLERALPDVRGRPCLGGARPSRVRRLDRPAHGVAARLGPAARTGRTAADQRGGPRPARRRPALELADELRELHQQYAQRGLAS